NLKLNIDLINTFIFWESKVVFQNTIPKLPPLSDGFPVSILHIYVDQSIWDGRIHINPCFFRAFKFTFWLKYFEERFLGIYQKSLFENFKGFFRFDRVFPFNIVEFKFVFSRSQSSQIQDVRFKSISFVLILGSWLLH